MKIRQIICKHDFKKTGTALKHKNRHYIVPMTEFKCTKCGKVVYR